MSKTRAHLLRRIIRATGHSAREVLKACRGLTAIQIAQGMSRRGFFA